MLADLPAAVPMKPEQERALTRRAQKGSAAAAAALVSANLRLVVYLVGRLRSEHIQLDDLVQEGVLGIYHAIRKFDSSRGSFRSYAGLWILAYARRFVSRAANHDYSFSNFEPSYDGEAAMLDAEHARVTEAAVSDALASLRPAEAAIVSAATTAPYSKIALGIGVSRQRVGKVHKAARAKFSAAIRRDRRARSLYAS